MCFVCACACVCGMCVHAFVDVYACVCGCVCMRLWMFVHAFVDARACDCVRVHVFADVCAYVCGCVCTPLWMCMHMFEAAFAYVPDDLSYSEIQLVGSNRYMCTSRYPPLAAASPLPHVSTPIIRKKRFFLCIINIINTQYHQ